MVVERTWRSADRRYLVDELLEEDVAFRIWDAEGSPVAVARGAGELRQVLASFGVDQDQLESVPTDDPWCE